MTEWEQAQVYISIEVVKWIIWFLALGAEADNTENNSVCRLLKQK